MSSYSFPPMESSYEEAIDQCAQECILAEYMCNSFILTDDIGGRLCLKYVTTASDLSWHQYQDEHREIITIYELRKPRRFDILSVLSSDIEKKSEKQWTNHLLEGYDIHPEAFLKDIFYVPFLLGCWKSAMYGQPSKGVDFDTFLAQGFILKNHIHDPEERLRKYSRISRGANFASREFSFREGDTAVHVLPDTSELFQSFVLDFLDIFSRTIRPGIITIYDPKKKLLFIEENDLHLLITAVGSGEYIVVRQGLNLKISNPLSGTEDERNQKEQYALEMFKLAMRHFDHTIDSWDTQVRFVATQNEKMSAVKLVINMASYVMCAHFNNTADAVSFPFPQLTGDLVEFVLLKVYGESRRLQYYSHKSGLLRHFYKSSMVDIITTNNT